MDFAINGVLPGIMTRFRRLHPEVEVELRHLWTEGQRIALLQHVSSTWCATLPEDERAAT